MAGAIIAVLAVSIVGGSGTSSFHAARGLPYLQGVAYFNDGEYEQAVDSLDDAIRFNSVDSEAHRYRGRARSKLGRRQAALDDLSRAIDLDPTLALAYDDRGVVYQTLGQHQRAIEDHDAAIELDPRSALAYANRAAAYRALDQPQRSAEDFKRAGELFYESGQFKKAIDEYDKAVQADPEHGSAYASRGAAYEKLAEHERAI